MERGDKVTKGQEEKYLPKSGTTVTVYACHDGKWRGWMEAGTVRVEAQEGKGGPTAVMMTLARKWLRTRGYRTEKP